MTVGCADGATLVTDDEMAEEDADLDEDDEESAEPQCEAPEVAYCGDVVPACADAVECTPCTDHAQCATAACDYGVGACFAAEDIRLVDPATCGSADGVFCSISNAVADITDRGAIRVQSELPPGPLVVSDKSVTVIGPTVGVAMADSLSVTRGELYVHGLSVASTTRCSESILRLDVVDIDADMSAEACDVSMYRTQWYDVVNFTLPRSDSHFYLENSFINADVGLTGDRTEYDLNFSTFYTAADLVLCNHVGLSVKARGSILLGGANWSDPVDCATDDFFGNVGNSEMFAAEDGNRQLLGIEDAPLIDPPNDLHLYTWDGLVGIANSLEAPATDYDGDPRSPTLVIPGADAL